MRLNCRTAENLLLADEVLAVLGLIWDQMREAVTNLVVTQEGTRVAKMSVTLLPAEIDRRLQLNRSETYSLGYLITRAPQSTKIRSER